MVGNFTLSYLLFYQVIEIFNARLVPFQILLGENFTPFTGSLYKFSSPWMPNIEEKEIPEERHCFIIF